MPNVTPIRTADVTQNLGINTHLDYQSYTNVAQVESDLTYLGVSNVRDSPQTAAAASTWLAVAQATGVKFDAYIPETSVSGMSTDLGYIPALAKEGVLNCIEGGDEEDTPFPAGLGNTLAITAQFQQQVWALGQSLGLPVINMSFGAGWTATNNWQGNYGAVGDLSAYANYGNAHTYPSGAPGGTMRLLNADALLADSSDPVITTEIGWNHNSLTDTTIAKYSLDAVMDGKLYGDAKTYFYSMYDDSSGTYGMFNADGTPRLAATAIHNLQTMLADTGSAASSFMPGALSETLSGTIAGDNSLLMEKSDGSFWLSLWNESETAGSPHNVTLTLGSSASQIMVFDPLTGTTAISTASNVSGITISVPDHPVLVEIIPIAYTTINGTAGSDSLVASQNNTIVNSGEGNDTIVLRGTGDIVSTGNGNNSVSGFAGGNKINTGSGNDIIRIAGSGSVVDAGAGSNQISDSGTNNTIILPSAGAGTDDIFGYVLQGNDTLDLTKALAATSWNGNLANIGSYLHTSLSGANAVISITNSASSLAGVTIATLHGSGSISLSTLLAHSTTGATAQNKVAAVAPGIAISANTPRTAIGPALTSPNANAAMSVVTGDIYQRLLNNHFQPASVTGNNSHCESASSGNQATVGIGLENNFVGCRIDGSAIFQGSIQQHPAAHGWSTMQAA